MASRLEQQLAFCLEIDRVKSVLRQNFLADASRQENDAEHMWHLAVMALVLAEHAASPVDVQRVLSMVLIHDLVEIDAGDTFIYDDAARVGQAAREEVAAERIFGLLPPDQESSFRALWDEFEEGLTADSRFARALDRLQPLTENVAAGGGGWAVHGITADRVRQRNSVIEAGSSSLWEAARRLIADAVATGILAPGPTDEAEPTPPGP
jgi:putative hydrolase of HD superfamily